MLGVIRSHSSRSAAERELNYTYAAGLLSALTQREDPSIIPLLIEYAGMMRPAADGLVQYGNLVVGALIERVNDSSNDDNQRQGATAVLARLLCHPDSPPHPLDDMSKNRLTRLAYELLGRRFEYANIVGTTNLALASKVPELRSSLELLAADQEQWIRRGVTSRTSIDLGQHYIRYALQHDCDGNQE
jgi:hypothetical protein